MMQPNPSVAVVILNWNGKHLLQQFLPSVLQTQYPNYHIVVADNASTDGSVAMLREHFPMVSIVQNAVNFGFTGGYNQSLPEVKADYYVLLNSDVEVTSQWLTPVIALMESDERIAACQPKVLAYHQKTHFEYAGAAGGWIDALGYAFCRGRFFDVCEPDVGQYDTIEEVFWASGCAMFIRAKLFHQFSGFDNHFFAHMEEIDLCWRLKRAGYRIMVCPQSVVYHVGGGSLHKSNPRKTFLNYHNNLLMLYKNLPAVKLWWLLPVRFVLDWVSGIKLLSEGKWADTRAIIRAQYYFLKGLPVWHRQRRVSQQAIKHHSVYPNAKPNPTAMYRGSIIIQHFLLRKNRFSDLPPPV